MQATNPQDINPLDALIAAYLEAVERGEQPDRDRFIQEHPEFTTELRAFFADLDKVEATKLQAQLAPETTVVPQHEPKPGAIISGRYKLLENIGEGGMGSVWVAEQQQPVKRRVAIKLVKAGMDSKQVLARFEAERQALAVMDHPNIAKVFDGGMTEQGRPYFVMEYVRGIPITAYCDQARLSLKDRLNLFIPVCQAVQHAHHKGIVHRDLKPSNILICLYDGKPVPKVIDFGLAKAMHQSLTDQSIYTGHGIMVGTPLYMSPEQAEHNNLDVDTRTDIYSLGVVLYELLVGTTPLERDQLRKAAIDEVLRLIREVEPPRPSVRLSSSASLPSIAAQRSIDPKQLSRSLAGDLDWIVMKSLEKERTRRYETATGLARDIERFLNDEAVEACPPSRTYRLKKFVRKHRGKVFAASVVFLAMFVGVTGATWGWFRATEAEQTVRESLGELTKERDAKNDALTAEAAQREFAERALIAGMLRPIGYGGQPELGSFVDWSALSNSRLKLRVLEVAFERPETALRVASEAERSVQACVGLSLNRRARAIELVSNKQRDRSADPRIRVAACWLAMELGATETLALQEAVQYLASHAEESPYLYGFLKCAVRSTIAARNTARRQECLDVLISLCKSAASDEVCEESVRAITLMASQLSAEQTFVAVQSLIRTLEDLSMRDVSAVKYCVEALVPQLSESHLTQTWVSLNQLLTTSTNEQVIRVVGEAMEHVARRLAAENLPVACDVLIDLQERSLNENVLAACARSLAALGAGMTQDQASRVSVSCIKMLETSTDVQSLTCATEALTAAEPHLTQEWVERTGASLTVLLSSSKNRVSVHFRGNALAALTPRLPAEVVTECAESWMVVLSSSQSDWERLMASTGLNALAVRLTKDQGREVCLLLIDLLERSRDFDTLAVSTQCLASLSPHLPQDDALLVWHSLIRFIGEKRQTIPNSAWDALAAVAPRLSQDQAIESWEAVSRICATGNSILRVKHNTQAFAVLAATLPSQQVRLAFDSLNKILDDCTNDFAPNFLAAEIKELAIRMEESDRVAAAQSIFCSLRKTYLGLSTESAYVILSTLDPTRRNQLSSEAVLTLLDFNMIFDNYFTDSNIEYEYGDEDQIYASVFFAAGAMNRAMAIAEFLSHPGCVGEPREILLQRFEELVFHDGRHIFLKMPGMAGTETSGESHDPAIHPTDSEGSPDAALPPRRFHNLHDAAAWIQQNWPDFDLEATHPVIWRGER